MASSAKTVAKKSCDENARKVTKIIPEVGEARLNELSNLGSVCVDLTIE